MNTAVMLPTGLTSVCLLGDDLVSKMISGFSGALGNAEIAIINAIDEKITSTADEKLGEVISRFFNRANAAEMAIAFDVEADHLDALKSGVDLKTTLIDGTRKVLMLSALTDKLSIETIDSMVENLTDFTK